MPVAMRLYLQKLREGRTRAGDAQGLEKERAENAPGRRGLPQARGNPGSQELLNREPHG